MTTIRARYKDGVLFPLTTIDIKKLKKQAFQVIIVEEEPALKSKQSGDLLIINKKSKRLNKEAIDVLDYQDTL